MQKRTCLSLAAESRLLKVAALALGLGLGLVGRLGELVRASALVATGSWRSRLLSAGRRSKQSVDTDLRRNQPGDRRRSGRRASKRNRRRTLNLRDNLEQRCKWKHICSTNLSRENGGINLSRADDGRIVQQRERAQTGRQNRRIIQLLIRRVLQLGLLVLPKKTTTSAKQEIT